MRKPCLLLALMAMLNFCGCDEDNSSPVDVEPSEQTKPDFIVQPGVLTIYENGSMEKVTVRLLAKPTAPVTIRATLSDETEFKLHNNTAELNADNWSTGFAFYLQPIDDGIADGAQFVTITFTVESTDPVWNALQPEIVQVTCIDSGNIVVDCYINPSDPSCKVDCSKTPNDPSCKVDCSKTPEDPSCKVDCSKTPDDPSCKVDCSKTPEDPSCVVDCSKTPNDPSCRQKVDCSKTPEDPSCPQKYESCNTEKSGIKLRFMSSNTTSGNDQDYNDGKGLRMFQAMKPDIVVIQEFNYKNDTDEDIRSMIDKTFGTEFYYARGDGTIPNGVISRYPIKSTGEWGSNAQSNRNWDWAVIDIPGERDLLAVSVHLGTKTNGTEMPVLRDKIVNKQKEGNYYVVLGGDFNTDNRTGACSIFEASKLQCAHGQCGIACSTKDFPVDQDGNGMTSGERDDYYDYLLFDEDLSSYEVPVSIGSRCYPNGHVLDSRIYDAYDELNDIPPVKAEDSWLCIESAVCCGTDKSELRYTNCEKRASNKEQHNTNFQHMPVIRDIILPE